jgi:hypothetical protein
MRSQDLRLARHSLESNLDLTVSLLRKVAGDDGLDAAEREETARILARVETILDDQELGEEERRGRVSDLVGEFARFDDSVNGPLPSEA